MPRPPQLFPLTLKKTLVEKFCNNFSVVEVWHRAAGQGTDDQVEHIIHVYSAIDLFSPVAGGACQALSPSVLPGIL